MIEEVVMAIKIEPLFRLGEFNPENDCSRDFFDFTLLWSYFPRFKEEYDYDSEVTTVSFVSKLGDVRMQWYKSRPYLTRFDLNGRPIKEHEFDKLMQQGVCLKDGLA